ncbi:MAG TPA: endopeptidase La [Candidatus Babeliales bacterium]|nr:endopeptidase La [Candidatus Babeliales bacterium]
MKSVVNQKKVNIAPETLSVIPTMDVVVFPQIIVPLLVIDEKIISGINRAIEEKKMVFLLAAKNGVDPHGSISTDDLYAVGTIANIMRLIKMPEGGIKILVQGVSKARVLDIMTTENILQAKVQKIEVEESNAAELTACVQKIKKIADQMATSGYTFSPDFHIILSKMTDADKIGDFILSHLNLNVDDAQKLLETDSQKDFLTLLADYLSKEVQVAEIQEKIRNNARESMNRSQKEFYLREQLKAIKQELGEDDLEEIEDMRERLHMLTVSDEIKKEISRHINRLERTAPDSLEATVTRNHLEWIFALPWNNTTEDNLDIVHAKAILDEDHFGLKEIKERILDFISVRNLKKDGFAPILCFVGPPGTGKTSLGKSIARSLGREYGRISLGGVKDEAEIRGHRRTYVGAMPGRFIQALRKSGSRNPLLVIDELDKIGADFRGDPSAAMLEVLDPQQNKTFYDNYLGIPFDLSEVMFIATANSVDIISEPLRDRMEIIELSGYTMEEKTNIAQKHLVRKAIENAGLENNNISIPNEVIQRIISDYTRESGVRQLERLISKLCSKAARALVETKNIIPFSAETLESYLGPCRFIGDGANKNHQIGISNGLAWTVYGGEILQIEAMLMPGTGKLLLTGQLGDVMKESAQAARSYACGHAQDFGIDNKLFTQYDMHIHLPAGAVPKDGPSAGLAILTAMLSTLTNRPINSDYAMTGELNLRGEVMPIGGVKEKILAAKRNNIPYVILPRKNSHNLAELDNMADGIDIILVDHANDILDRLLMPADETKGSREC